MIEEWDEDVQTIKGTPKGPKIKFQSLKPELTRWRTKNKQWTNEERPMNDVEIDCSHNSVAF